MPRPARNARLRRARSRSCASGTQQERKPGFSRERRFASCRSTLAVLLTASGCPGTAPHTEPVRQAEPAPPPGARAEPKGRPDPSSASTVEVSTPADRSSTDSPKPFHPFALGYIDYPRPFDGEPVKSERRDGGLEVDDFVLGTGEPVAPGHYVTFHYTGYLDDGYVFDSSRRRRRPRSFFVGAQQAIAGWDRGLRGMQVGGQRRLRVPSPLAFGDRGRPQVPPGATVVFTVELLSRQGPFADPTPSAELRRLARQTDAPDLRPPHRRDSRAAAEGDQMFVHYETLDTTGKLLRSTHRRGVPTTVTVEGSGWTRALVGLRVGGSAGSVPRTARPRQS